MPSGIPNFFVEAGNTKVRKGEGHEKMRSRFGGEAGPGGISRERGALFLNDLVGGDDLYALGLPFLYEFLSSLGEDGLGGVEDEGEGGGLSFEEAFDGVGVADIEGNAVDDDLFGPDGVQDRVDVRVGEDVEALLAEEDFTRMVPDLPGEAIRVFRFGVDPDRVLCPGCRDFFLSGSALQAVGGEGLLEVRVVGEFRVVGTVVVHRAEDWHPLRSGVAGEPLQVGEEGFGSGDVELAVRHDKIDLGVHIPEEGRWHFSHSFRPWTERGYGSPPLRLISNDIQLTV